MVLEKVYGPNHHREACSGFDSISANIASRVRITLDISLSPSFLCSWERQFIELQGVPVLARTLLKISAKRSLRYAKRDASKLCSDVHVQTRIGRCTGIRTIEVYKISP